MNMALLGLFLVVTTLTASNLAAQAPATQPAAAAPPAAAQPAPAAPAVAAAPAPPKEFRKWAYDKDLRTKATLITKIVAGTETSADVLPTFDEYYEKFIIGRWTEPENRNILPKFRTDLRNNLATAKTGPIHVRLTGIIMRMMSEAAFAPDFDPVVRANAMLMIGELNADDSNKPNEPPVPLPQAIPTLLRGVRDAASIDPVRVAALAGLLRHARLGIANPGQASEVSSAMVELLRSKNPPLRSAAGHAWLRARAADVLGAQGSVGQNNTVADALAEAAADSSAPLFLRRSAADALGRLNYQGAANLNGDKLATAIASVAVAAVESAGQELEAKKTNVYRPMKSAVYVALAAVNALAPTAGGKAVQLQAKLQQMAAATERTNDDSVVNELKNPAAELKALAGLQ